MKTAELEKEYEVQYEHVCTVLHTASLCVPLLLAVVRGTAGTGVVQTVGRQYAVLLSIQSCWLGPVPHCLIIALLSGQVCNQLFGEENKMKYVSVCIAPLVAQPPLVHIRTAAAQFVV
jgi:hypothetical protein